MKNSLRQAFTLIELLVVVAVIAILAGVAFPVFSSIQLSGRKLQSLNNLRQFGTALISYGGENNGALPGEGVQSPGWAANTDGEAEAWYNVLPRRYGNGKGLGDYAQNRAAFYTKNSMFYVSAAKYPTNKLNAPVFAVALCSKLFGSVGGTDIDPSFVRLQNFQLASQTVIFQESGLSGEAKIRSSQSSYNGQSKSFASRSVARYGGKTLLVFADGHADAVTGTDIVDPSGKAYNPQIGIKGGTVLWTMNPTVNANQ